MARWQGHSLLEYAEAHTEARDLLGWAGSFRVAANELREAHRALVALGVRDRESASEFWTKEPAHSQ
jgi:hypothetical protein